MRAFYTIKDLIALLRVSEATIRRWHSESRSGTGNFPKSVNGFKRKLLWNPTDIERWAAFQNATNPPLPIPELNRERSKRHSAAMQSLKQKGVILPSQK